MEKQRERGRIFLTFISHQVLISMQYVTIRNAVKNVRKDSAEACGGHLPAASCENGII